MPKNRKTEKKKISKERSNGKKQKTRDIGRYADSSERFAQDRIREKKIVRNENEGERVCVKYHCRQKCGK